MGDDTTAHTPTTEGGAERAGVAVSAPQTSLSELPADWAGLLVFTAPWCPLWEQFRKRCAPDSQHVHVIDTDADPGGAELWRIQVVPTVVAVSGKKELRRHTGVLSADIWESLTRTALR